MQVEADEIDFDNETVTQKARLLGSLLEFTQVFYKLRTGRDFVISEPIGRESHLITISKELTKVIHLETNRLLINVPPGFGKSEMMIHFVAWSMAHYPDSQFIYVSYGKELAAKHTYTIRQIIELPAYRRLFGVHIKQDSSAKDNFKTEQGGSIMAFGSSGPITGQDAGLPNLDRFSGGVIIDDALKPDDAFSDTLRENVWNNYNNTIFPRPRGVNVPMICIGQRLHEEDLPAKLIRGDDGYRWNTIILKALDEAGNSLNPAIRPVSALRLMQEKQPYVFAAQFQQDPSPAGGGIFKPEWFVGLDDEPEILATFITADTAETDKNYNDATVFSFWGIYKIKEEHVDIDLWGLHWIDCVELRVEPKDLESEFRQFYAGCLRHKVKPKIAAIEKKSTGVTLVSVLSTLRGLQVLDIPRNTSSGSKTARFMAIQPYIASRRVSITNNSHHQQLVLEHCRKITANNTHRFDDVCLAQGTYIATLFGYKKIEDIKCGDFVITPFGINKVLTSSMTNQNADVINYKSLTGTSSHPVFIGNSFEPMGSLDESTKINYLSYGELIKWKYKTLLNSMDQNIDSWGRKSIISANEKIIKSEKVLKDCMLQFGNFITNKQYKKVISFIIKMGTLLITTSVIWNVFLVSNILKCMHLKKEGNLLPTKKENTWIGLDCSLKNGTKVQREGSGTVKMPKSMLAKFFMNVKKLAHHVALFLLPRKKELIFAAIPVTQDTEERTYPHSITPAFAAISSSKQKNVPLEDKEKHVADCATQKLKVPVYNITVEKAGVYFANNILVSNCDTLADAVRMALIDESISHTSIYAQESDNMVKDLMASFNYSDSIRDNAYGRPFI